MHPQLTHTHILAEVVGIEAPVDDIDGAAGVLVILDEHVGWDCHLTDILAGEPVQEAVTALWCRASR